MLEPDCAYTFPNEDGLTRRPGRAPRAPAPRVPRRPRGRLHADARARSPTPPTSRGATRESKLLGKLELPNSIRPAARPGLAFVGDAALAGDPFWGIGCGWAFQSAEWLVDETARRCAGGGDLDAALERYRRLHFRRLAPHQAADVGLRQRPARQLPRAADLARGAAGPRGLRAIEKVASRRAGPLSPLRPRIVGRAAYASLAR